MLSYGSWRFLPVRLRSVMASYPPLYIVRCYFKFMSLYRLAWSLPDECYCLCHRSQREGRIRATRSRRSSCKKVETGGYVAGGRLSALLPRCLLLSSAPPTDDNHLCDEKAREPTRHLKQSSPVDPNARTSAYIWSRRGTVLG